MLSDRKNVFIDAKMHQLLIYFSCFLVETIRTMLATALAAVATLQMILFCENDIAFGTVVIVFSLYF